MSNSSQSDLQTSHMNKSEQSRNKVLIKLEPRQNKVGTKPKQIRNNVRTKWAQVGKRSAGCLAPQWPPPALPRRANSSALCWVWGGLGGAGRWDPAWLG
jgi:hypothetical protein